MNAALRYLKRSHTSSPFALWPVMWCLNSFWETNSINFTYRARKHFQNQGWHCTEEGKHSTINENEIMKITRTPHITLKWNSSSFMSHVGHHECENLILHLSGNPASNPILHSLIFLHKPSLISERILIKRYINRNYIIAMFL